MEKTQKVAIVTGGLSGIGLASATRLIADGFYVFVGARRGDDPAHTDALRAKLGDNVTVRGLDVRDSDSVSGFVAGIMADKGRVDVLVNAAGVYEEAPVIGHPDQMWDATIDTNLSGTFKMIRAVMGIMKDQEYGRIVNIASVAAHNGMADNAAYCASKAGLLGLGRCVSLEGAALGITCNSISPTWVETEMLKQFIDQEIAETGAPRAQIVAKYEASNPQGKLVQPHEVANIVSFLASEGARAITMEDFQINAGSLW